jgi:hypothetical protein
MFLNKDESSQMWWSNMKRQQKERRNKISPILNKSEFLLD